MEERKFLHPSHTYDRDWVIKCLLKDKDNDMGFIRKGENVLEALGYDGHYCISLPYDCLLTWGNPIDGYAPHGRMFSNYESEVYLYYFE